MSEVKKNGSVTDLTVGQVVGINRAITRVRDAQNQMGQVIQGCSLPMELMFLNAWTQNEIKSIVEGVEEAQKGLRKKYIKKDKDGEPVPLKASDLEKMQKEIDTKLAEKAEVSLKKYKLSDLKKLDEESYLEMNRDHPVPQEYVSLLMDAGLIEDDTK